MMRKLFVTAAAAVGIIAGTQTAFAVGDALHPIERHWPTDGFFGTFDRAAVQRGFQVFKEVCSTCHSAKYLAFRNLQVLGFSEDEVKAIAAEYTVTDGPNDEGEMFERPGVPADHYPPPFPNPQAAAVANGGKAPPDLSLLVKAREDGQNYVYSILVGYEEPPADVEIPPGGNYNPYFPGHVIAMPPPLAPDQVTYEDGTEATVAQMASDVTQFLTWMAEPKLEARKQTGLKATLFLVILSGVFYAYKRKIWADLH